MMFSGEYTESPVQRKVRLCNSTKKTAEKLNLRLKHFLKHIDNHRYLSKAEKEAVKRNLLRDI